MRALIGGTVSEVKERRYRSEGVEKVVADVYVGQGRFFDKVSMPVELAPEVGDDVQYLANIKAKSVVSTRNGERFTFLDVWCIERIDAPTALQAVG